MFFLCSNSEVGGGELSEYWNHSDLTHFDCGRRNQTSSSSVKENETVLSSLFRTMPGSEHLKTCTFFNVISDGMNLHSKGTRCMQKVYDAVHVSLFRARA